jgi:CxxC-x17-CxxC domain-containing protein
MYDINFFAETNYRNIRKKFGIKKADRRQHMYVIGKTGVGKTSLLKNMAFQDIQKGEGLGIIDPHGEFAEETLDKIPSYRVNDVVYFNPADTDYPVSFNALEVPDIRYKHLVASGLMSAFTKIWANVWSARMEYILSNCILALLDSPGTTLLGILRMLNDKNYRQKIINNIKDPVVKSFWVNEYEEWESRYRNEAIAPIQNKVGQFLNVSLIRNIVGQTKSTIDISKIMNEGKILIMNLSKGRIGEDNSALLGAIMITKIQLAAMERVRIPEEERKDFYLYVDEFQNFVTQSFADILSEARKYHLNLIIAHQYIAQLTAENNTEVRDAVFGNVGTLVSFRVGAADAEFLEKEFYPEFTADDLVNLPNYHICLKLMIDGVSSRSFSAKTLSPISISDEASNREKIIKVSREQYSREREKVEEKIARWSGVIEPPAAVFSQSGSLHEAKCLACGKLTKVPFVPDGKRPVYCKTCFNKTEKGEIRIAGHFSRGKAETQEFAVLEKLGIEFKPTENGKEKEGRKEKRDLKIISDEKKIKTARPVSLKEALKKKPISFKEEMEERRAKRKKEVNIKEVREVLKEIKRKGKDERE